MMVHRSPFNLYCLLLKIDFIFSGRRLHSMWPPAPAVILLVGSCRVEWNRQKEQPMATQIQIDRLRLDAFCQRWKIQRLWLFGSVLRDDFTSTSDVDFLVEFQTDADWSLLDHVEMEGELAALLGRPVDLVTRRVVEQSDNAIRREAILGSAELFYVAG
jgi:predicted nucleotidyltransferase